MKYLACLLLLSFAATADDQGLAAPPASTAPDTPPALSDDEALAQQLVRCAIVEQKLGANQQMASGWSLSYNGAAVALTSATFVATQMVAQAGSADSLSAAQLQEASAQCRLLMFTNMDRIEAGMKHRRGGTADQRS